MHQKIFTNTNFFLILKVISTKNREHFFGEIQDGKMKVSPAGAIAHIIWSEIKNHTKNVELGEFIIMPNHVHGVLILKEDGGDRKIEGIGESCWAVACNGPTGGSPFPARFSLEESPIIEKSPIPIKNERMAAISPKPNTVSTIIRSYKSAVTKYCNQLDLPFAWQSRFYDHIIRNDRAFYNISEYIKNNPSKWKEGSSH